MLPWLRAPLRAIAAMLALLSWGRTELPDSEPAPLPAESPKLDRPALATTDASVSPEPPASLVKALEGSPYGGACVSVEHPYWPLEADRCSYTIGDRTYEITTATPSAERVARWITDASPMIPAMDRLRDRDPAAWETCLAAIARYTMNQSGRAFPLDGIVFETFEGPTPYVFKGGVTFGTEGGKSRSCGDCACRIESLHRSEWCAYVAAGLGASDPPPTEEACMQSLGGDHGWNDAWASTCLQIHASAWDRDRNDGVRALLHWVNVHQIAPRFPDPDAASIPAVVEAVRSAFGYPHRR